MKKIKYKKCYVIGDCLHIQFEDGESYNFWLDSVVEELVGSRTPLALDGGDSAASEQFPTPEVLSTLQGESTPAHRK